MIFGFEKNARYLGMHAIPFTVLINTTITLSTDELEEGWEGCLSVPGLRGLVPRYTHIQYGGFDVQGELISITAKGFHARVVQPELDHLDGFYSRKE